MRVPDNLIARIEAEGQITPPEGQLTQGLGDIGSMKLAMSLSDYGKDIEIVAPVQPSLQPPSLPSNAPSSKPNQTIGEPLTDDSVLTAYAQAMTSAGSAHVVGEVTIKDSPDAENSLMRQTFEGDGVLGGDNRTAGMIDVNDSGVSFSVPFESRRVGGVEFEKDPSVGPVGPELHRRARHPHHPLRPHDHRTGKPIGSHSVGPEPGRRPRPVAPG